MCCTDPVVAVWISEEREIERAEEDPGGLIQLSD
jgi:hypothetical protein